MLINFVVLIFICIKDKNFDEKSERKLWRHLVMVTIEQKKRYKCQLYKNAKRIKPFVCSYVFISNTIKTAFGDMHSVFGWPKVD